MYKTARTVPRPPQMQRRPRCMPLSRLSGATPTRAASCFLPRVPSSGTSERRVRERTLPTPVTLRRSLSFSLQADDFLTALSRSLSMSSSCCCSHLMVLLIAVRTVFEGGAAVSRFFSAVIISTTWRRRTTSASSSCVCSSRSGRTSGRMRSANRASTAASIASVLASCPVALAKSLTWRGFTATTGRAAPASAATALRSSPPVASRTISLGEVSLSFPTNRCTPSVEFGTDHASPVGETATSSTAFETSIPTKRSTVFSASFAEGGRRDGHRSSLRMRARGPRICSSSFPKSAR